MREIWDGNGDVGDKAHWTLDNGELKGRAYIRSRASRMLSGWRSIYSAQARASVLAATVDNDAWLVSRNGQTVASVVRDVVEALITGRHA